MLQLLRKWEVTFYRGVEYPTVKFIMYDNFLNNIIRKVGDINVEDAIQLEIREIVLPIQQGTVTGSLSDWGKGLEGVKDHRDFQR